MTLKYYHGPALANGLKSMVPLIEKDLPYESIYIDLHKFEQHEPWFLEINPEGQVPVLDHDGLILNHSTVINEYLEDVFPEIPLRPRNPGGAARMRSRSVRVAAASTVSATGSSCMSIGVSMSPGSTQLTRTSYGAASIAAARASPSTACFEAT